jgi:hypothetical protein
MPSLAVAAAEGRVSVPLGTSYIIKTIRLHVAEDAIFNSACDALGGLERAQLMQEAALFEANRLGVRFSAEPPPPLKKPWPYLPERGGEVATGVRISISLRVTVAELMSIAAVHVDASETLFIVGATLAYVGRLQSCYRGTQLNSAQEAKEARDALRRIKLPGQFRYRRPTA